MRIAVSADHRGIELLRQVIAWIEQQGHDVRSYAEPCQSHQPCDYPDMAYPVAVAVAEGEADRGILICGSGIGMCITANKVRGVRAALVSDEIGAEMSRRHNNANVLCLAADLLSARRLEHVLKVWLDTPFEGGRHARRVSKIEAIERGGNPADITGGEYAVAE